MTTTRLAPANLPLYGAIAALMALSVTVQIIRDRGWQPYTPQGVLWVRSGGLAKRLALSYDNLVADIYWMRAVVHFGGQRLKSEDQRAYEQLYPLLDLVTSLDPKFNVAYRFGAIFLAEARPGGAGRPDLAIQLLQKGIAANPRRWEYAQDIGFVYYFWIRDFDRAAEWFKRAGEIDGAAEWLPLVAATTLAEGGNRASSRTLWTELHNTTEISWIRTAAERRLQQLDAMDAIDELNLATSRFVARMGRAPTHWGEVAALERWRALPTDPTGMLYALDQETGRVSLSEGSSLWPLPDGPRMGPEH
jgi:tetratricopeptide (TPR) repeat protein